MHKYVTQDFELGVYSNKQKQKLGFEYSYNFLGTIQLKKSDLFEQTIQDHAHKSYNFVKESY